MINTTSASTTTDQFLTASPGGTAESTSVASRSWSAWSDLIDDKLLSWWREPGSLEDEDFEAPSRSALSVSLSIAARMRDDCAAAPDRIVPDGDGGVAMRWGTPGTRLKTLEIGRDGSVEMILTDRFQVLRKLRF